MKLQQLLPWPAWSGASWQVQQLKEENTELRKLTTDEDKTLLLWKARGTKGGAFIAKKSVGGRGPYKAVRGFASPVVVPEGKTKSEEGEPVALSRCDLLQASRGSVEAQTFGKNKISHHRPFCRGAECGVRAERSAVGRWEVARLRERQQQRAQRQDGPPATAAVIQPLFSQELEQQLQALAVVFAAFFGCEV